MEPCPGKSANTAGPVPGLPYRRHEPLPLESKGEGGLMEEYIGEYCVLNYGKENRRTLPGGETVTGLP